MLVSGFTPPYSLEILPVELIHIVTLNLSVKDLCYVQATNRRLMAILSNETIWRCVIRDILTVKPLLRLSYAYVEMTPFELRGTAIRLAAQDRLLRQDRQRPLALQHSFEVSSIGRGEFFLQIPVLLPGGRHFILPNLDLTQLRVFKTDGTPEAVCLLVPKASRPIYHWKAIPTSADGLLVAIVTAAMDSNKQWRSYVSVFHRNLMKGSCKMVCTFMIREHVDALALCGTSVALSWQYNSTRKFNQPGRFFYVRDVELAMETDPVFIQVPDAHWSLNHVTISLLSTRQLVVASHLAQFVVSMPESKPASPYAASTPTKIVSFESRRSRGTFHLPYFLPLSWEEDRPREVAIWLGKPLLVVSTCDEQHHWQTSSAEKRSKFEQLNTEIGSSLLLNCCAAGTTIVVANRIKFADTLMLTPSSASDGGLMRLDRRRAEAVHQGIFWWPLDQGKKIARMALDEEAGCILVLKYCPLSGDSFTWSISLYNLQ